MNTYLALKALHILGVTLFLGNIIITGWWKVMADRSGDYRVIAFAQRQVTLTDYVFTFGGVLLILATGIGNAVLHDMDYTQITWLVWGNMLFIASGIIWVVALIPIQIKQAKMAHEFGSSQSIPDEYWKLGKQWIIYGTIATVLPLMNIYWMVFKPV